jgi:hypothetical protein
MRESAARAVLDPPPIRERPVSQAAPAQPAVRTKRRRPDLIEPPPGDDASLFPGSNVECLLDLRR